MRLSVWSSDVCSYDLLTASTRTNATPGDGNGCADPRQTHGRAFGHPDFSARACADHLGPRPLGRAVRAGAVAFFRLADRGARRVSRGLRDGEAASPSRRERSRAISEKTCLADLPSRSLPGRFGLASKLDNLVSIARSEEHTSELQSLMRNSYAVFCLKKKNTTTQRQI